MKTYLKLALIIGMLFGISNATFGQPGTLGSIKSNGEGRKSSLIQTTKVIKIEKKQTTMRKLKKDQDNKSLERSLKQMYLFFRLFRITI